MEYKDYYKILGVEKTASQDEIKKAYRQLAKKYHPDKTKGDKAGEEKFKEVNEAYEVLGDEEKRKKYDRFGQYGNFTGGANFNPKDFESIFGGFKGFKGGGFSQGNPGGFSDFFSALFGGMGGGARTAGGNPGSGGFGNGGFGGFGGFGNPGGAAGQGGYGSGTYAGGGCGTGGCGGGCGTASQPEVSYDLETKMSISLKDAFEGKSAKVSYNNGEGRKTVTAKIPAGIESGQKIKLKGQGRKAPDGSSGDLYIKIDISSENDIELKGKDIYRKIEIYPWEAYLGTDKVIDTLDGKIKVKIPSKIKNGMKIKLAGKGYKDMKGNRGNLFIETAINNPDVLPDSILKAYETMKASDDNADKQQDK